MSDQFFPFLAEALTPWHAADSLARRLVRAGFTEAAEDQPWTPAPGRGFLVRRGGSALAACVPGTDPAAGWTIATAHTDSPGWRLKVPSQRPHGSGVVRIGTEAYGSPIHSTWLDRPLAVAGRVLLRGPQGPRELLVATEALATFPNLAIHYNKEVNKGFAYDLTEHLSLLAALGPAGDLQALLADRGGFDRSDWLSADLFAVNPAAPASLGGQGLFQAPRIDNLAGCDAVVEALIAAAATPSARSRLVLCFDQEEVGSTTWTGADSSFPGDLVGRVHGLMGGSAEDLYRAKARSFLASVDATHGVHPNWPGQHDEAFAPLLGQGPTLKASARFSYATTAATEARVRLAAEGAGVNLQSYVMKSTFSPGGTVGPIASSWTGIPGVDLGIPIWAMHSCVETADRRDQAGMVRLLTELFAG